MRRVNDSQVLMRREIQRSIGLIQLPEEYIMGKTTESSEYRWATCIDAKDIPTGARIVCHECMSQSLELIGDKVHRAPVDFVLGYISPEGGEFHCLKNVVLVKPDPRQETVENSFILAPDCSRKPSTTGTVISIGPDCKYVKPKDRVMFALFSGLDIQLDGETYLLLREMPLTSQYTDEIIGVIND